MMKAFELANLLCGADTLTSEGTVDKFKSGNHEAELSKVALCFIATPNVIREAAAWGAELVITHEPTYYDHWDKTPQNSIAIKKKELINELGITLFRYHDTPHTIDGRDLFSEGFIDSLGWKGTFADPLHFILDEEMTPREIVHDLEEKLDVHHVRLAGECDRPTKRVALLLGARGGEWTDFLYNDKADVAIGGEVCEWAIGEAARDASQMGIPKSVIAMGHWASECDGMKFITKLLEKRFGAEGIEFRYIECGDTYENL